MMEQITKEISRLLGSAGVAGPIELSAPPKPEMGDLAFACFSHAKTVLRNPAEAAAEIAQKISRSHSGLFSEIKAFGPYVNFYIESRELTRQVLYEIAQAGVNYGRQTVGRGRIMVEFAHPNTHKALHIGHLRNIITGESLVRLLENAGYQVIRANYQGDVGLHIAKCLWGIRQLADKYEALKNSGLRERVAFLGQAYAHGSQAYEADEKVKQEIADFNVKIYARSPEIQDVYSTTRAWSLEYFAYMYERLGTRFDRLYFESEVYERGAELVRQFVASGVFVESQGAIIFPGSAYDLHDRVFVNSQGFPTYEGKEVALAELQFSEHRPDKIIHITGREQADYFRVVFAAIARVFPETAEREEHLTYGWVRLKHGKMSSRTGQVVLAEWLLDEIEGKIAAIMAGGAIEDRSETVAKIGRSAVKYALLKTDIGNDIAFDLDESVRTVGDSGPYLLYIVARVKSVLKKAGPGESYQTAALLPEAIHPAEKQLVLKLADFPEVASAAAQEFNPSLVAAYLFRLAQAFNAFYQDCPILSAAAEQRGFRLELCSAVGLVMERGLNLLGIDVVEEM
ncbi:MAG: Arginine-tRNA ligase [Candidatus Magasanikbacteria bacterium GW2011_GWA2_56_11]|uniref:Arginine--tRNA ligase n=1 Tax=Candidatus Magasanikbacteria bacterium GW2011_GWA2_56_11 TaxID=1619044 RepID=A0A0G1YIA5_9BACT|nr:MAG: Arginine-tRNA ligase [Candidatus Magasanikbacteria bacterium GW2011_GWA2_56_11]